MRVIEKEMLRAILGGRDWSKDNTSVTIDRDYRDFVDVRLHGNHIATVKLREGRGCIVKPNIDTLLNYPTRTTMSRLRALGVNVCTRKGEVMLNGAAL